jgi:hypothetical protein
LLRSAVLESAMTPLRVRGPADDRRRLPTDPPAPLSR